MDWNLDKKPQNKGINAGKLKKSSANGQLLNF